MHVVDSHTGGMPTRVILDGGPDLGTGLLVERAARLAADHQEYCRSVLSEPRGKPGMVAALLLPADDPSCETGVIYFDRDAVLPMCGHGTIGLGVTLAHLGKIAIGKHSVETPAGKISIDLIDANTVKVTNIESRIVEANVTIETKRFGSFTGDLAYGGNWFFIIDPSPCAMTAANIDLLRCLSIAVREACHAQGVTGENGEAVDHVIFQGQSPNRGVHSRNFVLCPDDEYDRSPCGTGSSARLACLAARGSLAPGKEIVQESIIGSAYRLSYQTGIAGSIVPSITGQAYIMAEGRLIFDAADPFRFGVPLSGVSQTRSEDQ